MRDLLHNLKAVNMLHPIVGNNDSEGTPASSLDKLGYDSALVLAQIGISGDTLSGSVKVEVVAEHSDDNSTFAAITDAEYLLLGSGSTAPDGSGIICVVDDAAEDDILLAVGYVGPKQYFRLRYKYTGTHTNGVPIAMVGLLGHPQIAPVSNT